MRVIRQLISRSLRRAAPSLWQRLKYRQYLRSAEGEREIHVVERFIDPARAALDVGVHLGIYTRHFARYAKAVIGFEANPESAEFARRSLRGLATIHWAALSSQAGTGCLRIPVEGADGAEAALGTLSQANTLGGIAYREVQVPIKRLDDFELPPVGFVKIDVEGHEEEVLRGGEALLERDRPVYMIELEERHNANSVARAAASFEAHNYDGWFYDGSSFRNLREFDAVKHQGSKSPIYVNNFFFIPQEKAKNGSLVRLNSPFHGVPV